MSFKLKTTLLIVFLSLTPFIVTTLILGNAYRNEQSERIYADMASRLEITVDLIEQNLRSLKSDLAFIATLDLMNDIHTSDLDRRISQLLAAKKHDLQLLGNFDVTDSKGAVIASSDLARIGQQLGDAEFSVEVISSFTDEPVGKLHLYYDADNIRRLFASDPHFQYQLLNTTEDKIPPPQDVLVISRPLTELPQYGVQLSQDKAFAYAILDGVENSFYIALVIGMLAISFVAYAGANYVVKPILTLFSTVRSITKTQDYSHRVDIQRADEIGQLSAAFNVMIESMQQLLLKLQQETEDKVKLAEEANRAEMLQALSNKLSKYVSPQIYESIFSGHSEVKIGSSRKKLTVFFSDIVNFTGTTEQLESEDLTWLLNTYLKEMSDIALEYGATIDKYVGDAIMIFFGDPTSLGVEQDAKQCVAMAVAMQRRVKTLQSEWRALGITKPFDIRVGIHTGFCTVGNFGTENRMDYTIIGSSVNLASRIESLASPGGICVSEDTWLLVNKYYDGDLVDTITPKGMNQPTKLYQIHHERAEQGLFVVNEQGVTLEYDPKTLNRQSLERIEQHLEQIKAVLDKD